MICHKALVTTTIRLRLDCNSIAISLPLDYSSPPYNHSTTYVTTPAGPAVVGCSISSIIPTIPYAHKYTYNNQKLCREGDIDSSVAIAPYFEVLSLSRSIPVINAGDCAPMTLPQLFRFLSCYPAVSRLHVKCDGQMLLLNSKFITAFINKLVSRGGLSSWPE